MTQIRPSDDDRSIAVTSDTHFVLGCEHLGAAIAERLEADGQAVHVVDNAYDSAEVPGVQGSPTDIELLVESGIESASSVVIGTRSDAQNFLIAQLVRTHLNVPRVVVLVNDAQRRSPIAEAGHDTVCVTTVLSEIISERL